MLYLLALAVATAAPNAAPSVPPSPSATPIPTARPEVVTSPSASRDLPAVPDIEPGFTAGSDTVPPPGLAGVAEPFVGISLETAVAMALGRNTDLAVSQANRRIAAYQIAAAAGAYDLKFQLQPAFSYGKQPALSSFNAGPRGTPVQTISLGASAGFDGRTGTGGRFSATTSARRVSDNNTLDSYDPYYQTSLGVAYTQPLARGLAIDDVRRQIQLAKIGADLSDDQALTNASNAVDTALVAYYNLVAAWKNVAIQEDALRQARAQSESNARLVKRGAAARVDVIESDTQVSAFQDDVYSAIANVATYQNQLKAAILNDPADPVWTANLVPTSPVSEIVPEPKVEDVVLAAIRARPEVAQIRENIRAQNVAVAYAADQRKPQVDLTLGVTENGFAGRATDPNLNPFGSVIGAQIAALDQLIARANATAAPGTTPLLPISGAALSAPLYPGSVGALGSSYASALQGKYPQYSLSATIALPLRDRTANATYAAELERRRALELQEIGVVQRLEIEARNAVQAYRTARSRLVAARAARDSAERVEASEERKFRAGNSTTFLVLQRQVTVANDRGRELVAQSDVQKSLVELDRVTGTILIKNGVDVKTLGTAPAGTLPDLPPAPKP